MKFIGPKKFPDLAPAASETIYYDVTTYLSKKTGVTILSAAWLSDPTGLTFTSQVDTTARSTVLVTVPTSAYRQYSIKCKFTFSDGAVRTACAPMRVVCN